MKRLPILALLLVSLFCVLAPNAGWAQCSGTAAGNSLCSTPPGGSGFFTPHPLSSTDIYFGSGRPVCDVRAQGALGNGSNDDGPAFNTCASTITALGDAGGVIYAPPGFYCIKTAVTLPTGVTIHGSSMGGTVFSACGTNGITLFTGNGTDAGIYDATIFGKGSNFDATTFGATNPTIQLNSTCGRCILERVWIHGGSIPLYINGASEVRMHNTYWDEPYGSAIVLVQNSSAPKISNSSTDNQWPCGPPATGYTINPWASGHVYSANDVVSTGGYLIQTCAGGTSGGVAPTLKNYGVNMVDNTVTWNLAMPTSVICWQIDTGTSEMFADVIDVSGACDTGIKLTNTLAGTPPTLIYFSNTVLSQQVTANGLLSVGSRFQLSHSEIFGCVALSCTPFAINGSFTDGAMFNNNNFTSTSALHCLINAAGTNMVVTASKFTTCGQGIEVAAGVSNFSIQSQFGAGVTNSVVIDAGTSDNYYLNLIDASASGYTDGGSGTHKMIIKNGAPALGAPLTVASGGTGGATAATAQAGIGYPLTLIGSATNINMNSANTDTTINLTLSSTNWILVAIRLTNCSTSMTTATAGVFSATGGGGTALAANQAVNAVTSSAANTSGNATSMTLALSPNTWFNFSQLFFRVGTAQGAAATCNVYLYGYAAP